MLNPIPSYRKAVMAAGLMLVFLPLGMYVTGEDSSWTGLTQRFFPDFVIQYLVSTGITYMWIALAERVQHLLHRRWLRHMQKTGIRWGNLLAGVLFFVVSMTGIVLVLDLTSWLFYDALAMPCPIADYRHAERAMYGQFATLSLCVYTLISNQYSTGNLEAVQVKAGQLEKANRLAQFHALKSQINPHFLFNSLSILSSLVKKNPDLSEAFIDRLSHAYRYIIEQGNTEVVPLTTELDFLRAYTFLLQTRFGNKFEVRITLDPANAAPWKVPPLTLQILVENAVKHNRMSEREPLCIAIEQMGEKLEIRNKYRPRGETVTSTGMGLKNIEHRYALLTNHLVVAGVQNDEFVVTVPLLR
ncbi:MAG: histidine kinase [Bacteroidetes bacterium]|nr:MAG: histidine kinase [Bacteroidota bacterium]